MREVLDEVVEGILEVDDSEVVDTLLEDSHHQSELTWITHRVEKLI